MESDASEIRVIIKELVLTAPAINNGFQNNLKKWNWNFIGNEDTYHNTNLLAGFLVRVHIFLRLHRYLWGPASAR